MGSMLVPKGPKPAPLGTGFASSPSLPVPEGEISVPKGTNRGPTGNKPSPAAAETDPQEPETESERDDADPSVSRTGCQGAGAHECRSMPNPWPPCPDHAGDTAADDG